MLETTLAILARVAVYASSLTAGGVIIGQRTLHVDENAFLTLLVRRAAIVAVCANVCAQVLLFSRLGGQFDGPTLGAMFGEPAGIVPLIQSGAALQLVFRTDRWNVFSAVVLVGGLGLVGHPATHGVLSTAAAILHGALAAWWIGSLWILLAHMGNPAFPRVLASFSSQALRVVGVLLATGGVLAVILLGWQWDLGDDFARWLIAKLVLVASVMGLAALNKFFISPRLNIGGLMLKRLTWSIRAELAVMLGILVVIASMTTVAMPSRRAYIPESLAPAKASGSVEITNYTMTATLGDVPSSAAYLTISNKGDVDDRLISATCSCADSVTLHEMKMRGDVMTMSTLEKGLVIPARAQIRLAPMGVHLMLSGTTHRLESGTRETLVLQFERVGSMSIEVPVSSAFPGR